MPTLAFRRPADLGMSSFKSRLGCVPLQAWSRHAEIAWKRQLPSPGTCPQINRKYIQYKTEKYRVQISTHVNTVRVHTRFPRVAPPHLCPENVSDRGGGGAADQQGRVRVFCIGTQNLHTKTVSPRGGLLRHCLVRTQSDRAVRDNCSTL